MYISRQSFSHNIAVWLVRLHVYNNNMQQQQLVIELPIFSWFERLTMTVILFNCVTLGMFQPCEDNECDNSRCRILKICDDIIYVYFTVEMVIKLIAMGVFGKGCYLSETWNRLDCFIVLAG
jgi:hypothetical protein